MTKREFFLSVVLFVSFIFMIIFLSSEYVFRSGQTVWTILFVIFLLTGFVFAISKLDSGKREGHVCFSLLFGKSKLFNILSISFGISLSISLVFLVISFAIFEFQSVVEYVDNYFFIHLVVLTIVCIPFGMKIINKNLNP